jgi:hypothetical protein
MVRNEIQSNEASVAAALASGEPGELALLDDISLRDARNDRENRRCARKSDFPDYEKASAVR